MNSDNISHDDASVQVLSGILKDIGAIECLAAAVEDHDDDALKTLSKLKPERIASKFGMALNKAIAFVGKCLEASASYGLTGRGAAMSSSSPSPSASGPTVLPSLLRPLLQLPPFCPHVPLATPPLCARSTSK
jgi:hypothetical protein